MVGLKGRSYPEWSSTVSHRRTSSHAQSVIMCLAKKSGPSNVPMPRMNVSTGCAYSAAIPNGCLCSWCTLWTYLYTDLWCNPRWTQ